MNQEKTVHHVLKGIGCQKSHRGANGEHKLLFS